MLLDVDYILLGLPGVIVPLWAEWRLFRARAIRRTAGGEGGGESGIGWSGLTTTQRLLNASEASDAEVVVEDGLAVNLHDPGSKRVLLSPRVAGGETAIDLGTAAHEAAHAVLASEGDPRAWIRRIVSPLAELGSIAFWIVLASGLCLGSFRFIVWALWLQSGSVILQLLNLPGERAAVRRAERMLDQMMPEQPEEVAKIRRFMEARAWARVAATLTGAWEILGRLVAVASEKRAGRTNGLTPGER